MQSVFPAPSVIESAGSTSLVAVGSKFFLDSISTGSGPSLKYWRRGRGGGSVWWLDADRCRADGERLSGGLETPGRRSVYRSGIPIAAATQTSQTAFMSGAGAAIIRDQFPSGLERRRCDRCSRHRVIELAGSTSLVAVGSKFFLDSISTGSGPSLKTGGVDVVAGQFGGWTPIGVEQTASGYQVAWKLPGADQYICLGHR